MPANCRRADLPRVQFSALATKYHPAEFIAQSCGFFLVGRRAKFFGKGKKLLLFALLRGQAVFHQFHQHSIRAQAAPLGQTLNSSCDIRRKADTLANNFL